MTGLPIHTYRFEAEVTKKIVFRYFPGFVLRNALLHAMEELNFTRYVPDRAEKVVQPYLINADGLDVNDIFPAGTLLSFRLSLFGNANQFADKWKEAVRYLGSHMGIGPGSGRFDLKHVPNSLDEEPENKPNNGNAVTLRFPYLFFFRDRHKMPPDGMPFGELMAKIHSRYAALCMEYGNGQPQPLPTAKNMPQPEKSIFRITRLFYPPGGSKEHYDCFKGRITYPGNVAPYSEILKFGSHAGIGQFTAAGLGRFDMLYDDHGPPITL